MIHLDHDRFTILFPIPENRLNDYYRLRYEVLRKPWNQDPQSTKDDMEDQSVHILMVNEKNEAIACGRLQFNTDHEGQIRSMAVLDQYRNMQLGSRILAFLEHIAREKSIQHIVLDARDG